MVTTYQRDHVARNHRHRCGGAIQLRHLRAQNTLNAELAILKDWNDPQFRQWRFYIAGEMQTKIKDPAFLAEYDAPEVDRSRHPELYACDWLEQIGSYLKYGLLDPDVLLDVTSTSINRLWNQLAPAIERMRVTRGDSLYENFEYWAAKGRLWAKAHPGGAYPRNMRSNARSKRHWRRPWHHISPGHLRRHSGINRSRPFAESTVTPHWSLAWPNAQ